MYPMVLLFGDIVSKIHVCPYLVLGSSLPDIIVSGSLPFSQSLLVREGTPGLPDAPQALALIVAP